MPKEHWRFIALVHNLPLSVPVGNKYMALVPLSDARISQHMQDARFAHYARSFSDQFGRKRKVSALIARGRIRRKPDSVLAFRNSLAMSSVVAAWERFLAYDSQLEHYKFSGYFDIYPFVPSKDFSLLVVNSPSVLGADEIEKFHGQTSPELATAHASEGFFDPGIFASLMEAWVQRHAGRGPRNHQTEAVFRSLEMAYRATRVPFDNRASIGDYGAQLSLWVSAFEILAWPRNKRAGLDQVLQMLRPVGSCSKRLQLRRYRVVRDKKVQNVSLPEKLYWEIYKARNAFLHGDPVTAQHLFPGARSDRHNLLAYAPVLYKCALGTVLGFWSKSPTALEDILTWRLRHSALVDAICSATKPSSGWRRRAWLRSRTKRRSGPPGDAATS